MKRLSAEEVIMYRLKLARHVASLLMVALVAGCASTPTSISDPERFTTVAARGTVVLKYVRGAIGAPPAERCAACAGVGGPLGIVLASTLPYANTSYTRPAHFYYEVRAKTGDPLTFGVEYFGEFELNACVDVLVKDNSKPSNEEPTPTYKLGNVVLRASTQCS